jgi:hypothetical protein
MSVCVYVMPTFGKSLEKKTRHKDVQCKQHLDYKSGGPSGTLVNGQGCLELIPDYGAQRTHLYSLGTSGP